MPQKIEDEIVEFIRAEVLYLDEGLRLDRGDPLMEGLIDSGGLVLLIGFLEDRFGLEIEPDELLPENFGTIAAISSFIESKRGPR